MTRDGSTQVTVIATGGTLSSHFDGETWTNIAGAQLVDEVRERLPDDVTVAVVDVNSGPSSSLSVDEMVAIADHVRSAVGGGADGVVVLHGTDTIELTAFVAQLLLADLDAPIVFTGSMRVHSHPQADGPGNVVGAITVAASPGARGRGVLVCLGGTIHDAVAVSKVSAISVDAFSSFPFEPVGSVGSLDVRFAAAPQPVRTAATALDVEVPLVTCWPGMPAAAVEAALAGSQAAVIEVFGDLNVPRNLWETIHRAWNGGTLVVLASRPFTDTAADPGLAQLGAIGAGGLTAQKARLAVMAAVSTCPDRDSAVEFVGQYARHLPRQDWAT